MTVSTVLVCFAVREEARFFSCPPTLRGRVETLTTGMGRNNAVTAVGKRLAQTKPSLVLTCGFAGGLKPGLPVGSMLFSADDDWLSAAVVKAGAQPATFHCSARVAATACTKQILFESTGADAVEMESGPIRKLCRECQVPSATLRSISDAAEEDLPLDFNQLLTERCTIDYSKLAWAICRNPGRIGGLLRLQRQTTVAAQALARTLEQLLRGEAFVGH